MHNKILSTIRVEKGMWSHQDQSVVQEYPLQLKINGQEFATLIASPHQLNFLIIGFLYLQGFIKDLSDILSLGVCSDSGIADVRINGVIPEKLRPVLTSGCGGGITFNFPESLQEGRKFINIPQTKFPEEAMLSLLKDLSRKAENYLSHGGIHSAAVGDKSGILIYAEDIGRHNTLDRIAGEALFKSVPLNGKILVTSGRVSTEMVAKAIRLGVSLIASRTSATDMAIKMCKESGLIMVGYVRGNSYIVYNGVEY